MNRTLATELSPDAGRRAAVSRFVRTTFGLRGTLHLHRAALGLDLLRAPLNVALAPVFLLVRLAALLARLLRLRRLSAWLGSRRILLRTAVARRVEDEVGGLLRDLAASGHGVSAPPAAAERAVGDYVDVRSAVAEITTALVVVALGLVLFHTPTPGVVSLAGPISEMVGRASAVAAFPLGDRLGAAWYGVFPVELPVWFVAATGVLLAVLGSLVTTFAGVVADPLQALTGIHQRRLHRLLDALDRPDAAAGALPREHLAARLADLGDLCVSVFRALRP